MKVRGICRHETGDGKGSMGLGRSGGMHGHGNGYMHGYDSNGWGSVDEQQGYCGEGAMMTKFSFLSLQTINMSLTSGSWLCTFFLFVHASIYLISSLYIAQITPGHQQLFDSSQEWDQYTHVLHEKAENALISSSLFHQPRY